MAQTIQIRRGTGSAVPSSLAAGELAINTETGKFYYGNGSTVSSDFRVDSITAESYTVSSSVTSYTFQALSGSTDFGDDIGDIHNRTGSVNVSGSMSIATDLVVAGNLSVALGDGASNHIKLGNSTLGTTGGFLISGSSLGNPLITLKQSAQTATYGAPGIKFQRIANSDGSAIGLITYSSPDSAGNETTYIRISGNIEENQSGQEGGKYTVEVASHDGELQPGLTIEDGDAEDEVDVTIGNTTTSLTTIAGNLSIGNSITSNITASGNISASGNFDLTGNANIDGDLDVDGTTNLDVVDIDGTTNLGGTVALGSDGSGQYMSFFSNTAGKSAHWSNGYHMFNLKDHTYLSFGTVTGPGRGDMNFYYNGSRLVLEDYIGDNILHISSSDTAQLIVDGHITASGNISASGTIFTDEISSPSNNLIVSSSTVTITSTTDNEANLILESDTDNNDENDNPFMSFKQDGGAIAGMIGLSGDADKWPDGTTLTGVAGNAMIIGMTGAATSTNRQLYLVAGDSASLRVENDADIHIYENLNVTKTISVADTSVVDYGITNADTLTFGRANRPTIFQGTSFNAQTSITASGDISSSGTITGDSMTVETDGQAQMLISTTNAFTNRDVGLTLSASSNGQQYTLGLNRPSNTFVIAPSDVNAAPENAVFELDAIGNITASGNISASGDVIANAFVGDITGDLTGNADTATALTAGNKTLDGNLTIGAAGGSAGHDLLLYGDTNNQTLMWDASEDLLKFTDGTKIVFGTGVALTDFDSSIQANGNNLVIYNDTGNVQIGDTVEITGDLSVSAAATASTGSFDVMTKALDIIPFAYFVSSVHTSELYIPVAGSLSESNFDQYYHMFHAPYNGVVKRIALSWQSGTPGDSTIRVRKASNFDLDDSGDIVETVVISSAAQDTMYYADFSASFSKGDVVAFTVQQSGTDNSYIGGTIAMEFDTSS